MMDFYKIAAEAAEEIRMGRVELAKKHGPAACWNSGTHEAGRIEEIIEKALRAANATLTEKLALAEGSERHLTQCMASYAEALGVPCDADFEPPDIEVAIRKLQQREKEKQATINSLNEEIGAIRMMLHEAGFEKHIEVPTEEGVVSIPLREQVRKAIAQIGNLKAQLSRAQRTIDELNEQYIEDNIG